MRKKLGLLDLDGTLANYDQAMGEHFSTLLGAGEQVTYLSFIDDVEPHIRNRITLIRKQPGFWSSLKPIPLGFKVVEMLKQLDYALMVASQCPRRSPNAWSEKHAWCREHLPGVPVTLTESSEEQPANKALIDADLLFDDYPVFLNAWLQRRPDAKALMLHQPWNVDYVHPRVFRIRSEEDLPGALAFLTP